MSLIRDVGMKVLPSVENKMSFAFIFIVLATWPQKLLNSFRKTSIWEKLRKLISALPGMAVSPYFLYDGKDALADEVGHILL